MENAEMSLNANVNPVGGFAGMDAHKKALIGDQSELESGYVSSCSISNSQAGLSNSAKYSSSSFKRSIDLETISENTELKELQETPTTRSIRHLNAFHINTPQNTRDQLETTPKKANYFSDFHSGGTRSGNKKNRNPLSNIRWSLDKSSPKLRSPKLRSSVERMKSFSSQSSMFGSLDENYENVFNDEASNNVCNQSIGVSPIKPHNVSNAILQLPEKSQSIQRHASGIESSTPKNSFKRTRTQSIVKPKSNLVDESARDRLIRKTQSFSPSKRSALRETNFQHPIEPNEASTVAATVDYQTYNPARKVLEFTSETFGQLIQPLTTATAATTKTTTPKKSNISKDHGALSDASKTPKTSVSHTPKKRLTIKKSRLVKEFSRKKMTRSVTIRHTPTKSAASLNESDILAALGNENETDAERKYGASLTSAITAETEDSLMDISDANVSASMKTPSTKKQRRQPAGNLSDTPIRNDFVKQNIREEANRTPAKRFQKSTSCNFASIKSSPEKEKFEIVYGHLPVTPPKNRQCRSLKRSASAMRTDSPLARVEPPAKRKLKLYSENTRSMYYNGMEQLDVLTYFEKVNKPELAELILSYLPDIDLYAASMVCKSWRTLINDNRKFKSRHRKFVKTMEEIKENLVQPFDNKPKNNRTTNNNSIDMSGSTSTNNNNTIPLHAHNMNFSALIEKPVPISPSKRRFEEHQQIVESLGPDQRVLYCPRCNGTSIVHPASANESKVQRRSPRRQLHQTFQERSLRSFSSSSATKNKRNYLHQPVVISEYAACSKKSCGYEFCTSCYCNRHVNAKCTKRPLGSSPKSDDDTPYRCETRNNTKRSLRRLERLAF